MAQLNVDPALTPEQLVEDVLLGEGVIATNITFTGVPEAHASFTTGTTNLGISGGVILSTGDAATVGGPASEGVAINSATEPDNDADLGVLSSQEINNAAILEFDFVPNGDSLKFNFVFASEEYPLYVCTQYNDAFGFFLSGPGLNGTFSNNAVNLAVVPGTSVPITINTVNSGVPGGFLPDPTDCENADPNWQDNSIYFVDNENGTTVKFNGFTTVLQARASVICGETYHIKLAIGNGYDNALQSGVFLQAGSFASNALPTVSAATFFGDATASEGCQGTRFTLFRPEGVDTAYTVSYFLTGTAMNGVDYDMPPGSVTIPAGQDSVVIPFEAFDDGVDEGFETVIMNVYMINTCGDTVSNSALLALVDYPPMEITTETNILLECDQDSIPLFASVTGGFGEVVLAWGDTLPTGMAYVPGMLNGTYTITATDQCPKTVTETIVVDAGCNVIIPNVVSTGTSDGVNDRFVVDGIAGRENHVQIWDRWGKEVLNTRNYQNNFAFRGLNDGVYFYHIRVKEDDYTGYVQVVGGN